MLFYLQRNRGDSCDYSSHKNKAQFFNWLSNANMLLNIYVVSKLDVNERACKRRMLYLKIEPVKIIKTESLSL